MNINIRLLNNFFSLKTPVDECMLYPLLYTYKTNHDGSYEMSVDEFLGFAQGGLTGNTEFIQRATIAQEKCEDWWALKQGRITASMIHEVCNCGEQSKPQLVQRILGRGKPIPQTDPMRRGLDLQKEVIEVASRELNKPLSPCGLLLDRMFPVLGASPDAVGPKFVVEVKCPVSEDNIKNYVAPDNSLRPKVYAQIQLQMYLKKVSFGFFVIAHPSFETTKKIEIIKVDYNGGFTENMIAKAVKFWEDNVYPVMFDQIQ